MNIAFIHPNYPASDGTGATYSATQIVYGLIKRGHKVTVYCFGNEDVPREIKQNFPGDLKMLNPAGYPFHGGAQLNRALQKRCDEFAQFDVLHSYIMRGIPGVEVVGKKTSTSTIVTLNAYRGICPKNNLRYLDEYDCSGSGLVKCSVCSAVNDGYRTVYLLRNLKQIWEGKRNLTHIDDFHALSTHVMNKYDSFGFPRNRINVIPNMLDDRFLIEHESTFCEPYRLLYVGSLLEHKGVRILIPMFKKLQNETEIDFKLTIVGDGELRSELKDQAQALDILENVELAGRIPNRELPEIYASHDIFLYPGKWHEPFGRVFLEALATGLPIVANDVGSISEITDQGGMTINGDTDAFVEAILKLIEDDKLNHMSTKGTKVATRYKPKYIIPKFEKLYHRSLS